ncbi:hypothetical protein [Methylophaga sp.]|uniref:hypothetical protein n=1 Tax=Methylophaga sp. TaxID=2024840 RepID=UPI0025EEB408|nr:hypothetical protein [Methylophaga sp.]
MDMSDEINRMADEIEKVINSDAFRLGDQTSVKRLKFIASNYLFSGSYARGKAHEIASYADDFCKRGANQNLILAKIEDRLRRIKREGLKHELPNTHS